MDTSRAKKIVARADEVASKFFRLDDWTVWYRADALPEHKGAEVEVKPDYGFAFVVYDPAKFSADEEGEAELWATIGHELAHLLSAEFTVMEEALDEDKKLSEGDKRFLTYATERLTVRLEHLFRRHRPYNEWMQPKRAKGLVKKA